MEKAVTLKHKLIFLLFIAVLLFFSINLNVPIAHPSIVATSQSLYSTDHTQQRKTFYANGRFWVFYYDGDVSLSYKTSTDGVSWSSAINITSAQDGDHFSVWYDGTYLHYTMTPEDSYLYYRRGTPNSDGTITWSDTEQTVENVGAKHVDPFVSTDSNGYPFIVYNYYSGTTWVGRVTKSAWNNGTWSTASGFPYDLLEGYSSLRAVIVPLTAGKMYIIYQPNVGVRSRGRVWNGTDLGSEEFVSTSNVYSTASYSIVSEGDDVHYAFLKDTTYDIVYIKRTYGVGWGSETIIESSESTVSYPSLSINGSNLYVFWAHNDTSMSYKSYVDNTWSTTVSWFSDSIRGFSVTSFYEVVNSKLGLVWTTVSTPSYVKFKEYEVLDVTFSANPASPSIGRIVTISWVITKASDGSTVTDFFINVTKDGTLWKTNLTTSNTTDVASSRETHIYSASGVKDNTSGTTQFQTNSVTVTWSEGGGGGGGPITPTPPTEEPELPTLTVPPLATYGSFILVAIVVVAAVASQMRKKSLQQLFEQRTRRKRTSSKAWSKREGKRNLRKRWRKRYG